MLITYLTIEDIESGLFQTQVLDILTEISNQSPELRFEVLVINRPWLISSHLKKKKKLEQVLGSTIRIRYIPLLPPLRSAMSTRLYSAAVTSWLRWIYTFTVSEKSAVLHCRSYWPTQAALKSNRIPVLFDMRSLWPIENMSMGLLKRNSAAGRYWLNLEKECLERSKVSAGVSKGMLDYAKELVPDCNIELIPISVNYEKFRFDGKERSEKRKILGWESEIILVYSGSFGQANINIDAMKSLFERLLNADSSTRLLFLTGESDEKVDALMKLVPASENRYKVLHPKLSDIGKWLSAGDIGVHALPKQLDYKTRLGTKCVECWINGLPMIVNEWVGAAADLINEYKVGAVISANDPIDPLATAAMMRSLKEKDRSEQTEFAKTHFSTEITAKQYIKAYRDCVS